mmetsp:Transcript_87001/g.246685  ORF Transcript_87001/g.246685 Transcript_87001/m.246685 type:complete len:366 (-) Transcript_87001:217-1314(-)
MPTTGAPRQAAAEPSSAISHATTLARPRSSTISTRIGLFTPLAHQEANRPKAVRITKWILKDSGLQGTPMKATAMSTTPDATETCAVQTRPWFGLSLASRSPTHPPSTPPMPPPMVMHPASTAASVSAMPQYWKNSVPKESADHGTEPHTPCATMTWKLLMLQYPRKRLNSPERVGGGMPAARGGRSGSTMNRASAMAKPKLMPAIVENATRQPWVPMMTQFDTVDAKIEQEMFPKFTPSWAKPKNLPRSWLSVMSATRDWQTGVNVPSIDPLSMRRKSIDGKCVTLARSSVMVPQPRAPQVIMCFLDQPWSARMPQTGAESAMAMPCMRPRTASFDGVSWREASSARNVAGRSCPSAPSTTQTR